jgi:hypothetical protein
MQLMSKSATAAERGYMARVKALPCSCCNAPPPSSAHHTREEQGRGQKSKNWLVMALCYDCHQGPLGLHGDKTLMRIRKLDEMDLLGITIERLNK